MPDLSLTVNGTPVAVDAPASTLLSDLLRQTLKLTGTHIGCDTSQCGACVVHVNGKSVKACAMLALEAEGTDVVTIEGYSSDGELNPIQQAFRDHHGLQCGFCTPGMVMTAAALLQRNPDPTEDEIREELEGNLCRCTGYQGIVNAIQAAARSLKGNLT